MADDQPSPTSDTHATPAGFTVEPGAILANRYEILEYIGKGGMGVVYKAHDRTLDETVAIKILRQQPFDDPSLTQRFLAEIKLARRVTHKNVCRIHDYGEAESVRFISMQFVEGIELGQMVRRRGRLSADEGYDIALQLVDGLEAIHDQAIVHRDLKTSNVMIDRRGTALLMDFGIAKLWEGEAGTALTASGQIIGTPQYMSPEQAQGEPLDPRSDIYAIGVVLFELFTGALPVRCRQLRGDGLQETTRAAAAGYSGRRTSSRLTQTRHQEGTRHGGCRPLCIDTRAQSRLARSARTDACRRPADPRRRSRKVQKLRDATRADAASRLS